MSVGIFTWLLQYFPKNRDILVQKLWGEKKVVKIRFLAILGLKNKSKKKFRWPLSSRWGGVRALVARPLVDELFFCGFPYILCRVRSALHHQKLKKLIHFFFLFNTSIENKFPSYKKKRFKGTVSLFWQMGPETA